MRKIASSRVFRSNSRFISYFNVDTDAGHLADFALMRGNPARV